MGLADVRAIRPAQGLRAEKAHRNNYMTRANHLETSKENRALCRFVFPYICYVNKIVLQSSVNFAERCVGVQKITIEPFINSKFYVQENIILRRKDYIVNNAKSVAKIFSEYFTEIGSAIGLFHDPWSSNGNIFRVIGPLCGEFTGPGEFPTQRPVTRSFDVFFDLRLNKRLSKQP